MLKQIGYIIITFGIAFGIVGSIAATDHPTSGVTCGDKNGQK